MRRRTPRQRFCDCGATLPKRRRYCDECRERRKRETMTRFNQKHPGRRHKVTRGSTVASGTPQKAPDLLSEAGQSLRRTTGQPGETVNGTVKKRHLDEGTQNDYQNSQKADPEATPETTTTGPAANIALYQSRCRSRIRKRYGRCSHEIPTRIPSDAPRLHRPRRRPLRGI